MEAFPIQFVGEKNLQAVCDVANALPLMFTGLPHVTDIGSCSLPSMACCSRSPRKCHPTFFNVEPNEKHEPYDKDRDQVALELTRACVAKLSLVCAAAYGR